MVVADDNDTPNENLEPSKNTNDVTLFRFVTMIIDRLEPCNVSTRQRGFLSQMPDITQSDDIHRRRYGQIMLAGQHANKRL